MNLLKKLKEETRRLRSELLVLIIAYKDKRTPLSARFLIGLTAGYLLSPVDLIPDFIPVLGLLDDLVLVPVLIRLSISLIPRQVLEDARHQVLLNPPQLKKKGWLAVMVIVLIWIAAIYLVYRLVR